MVTHVAQTELMVFVVTAECSRVQNGHQTCEDKTIYKRQYLINLAGQGYIYMVLGSNLRVQAFTPSDHV